MEQLYENPHIRIEDIRLRFVMSSNHDDNISQKFEFFFFPFALPPF